MSSPEWRAAEVVGSCGTILSKHSLKEAPPYRPWNSPDPTISSGWRLSFACGGVPVVDPLSLFLDGLESLANRLAVSPTDNGLEMLANQSPKSSTQRQSKDAFLIYSINVARW